MTFYAQAASPTIPCKISGFLPFTCVNPRLGRIKRLAIADALLTATNAPNISAQAQAWLNVLGIDACDLPADTHLALRHPDRIIGENPCRSMNVPNQPSRRNRKITQARPPRHQRKTPSPTSNISRTMSRNSIQNGAASATAPAGAQGNNRLPNWPHQPERSRSR